MATESTPAAQPNKGRARSAKAKIMSEVRKQATANAKEKDAAFRAKNASKVQSQRAAEKVKGAEFRAKEQEKVKAARAQGQKYKAAKYTSQKFSRTAATDRAGRKAERAGKAIKKGLRSKYIDLNALRQHEYQKTDAYKAEQAKAAQEKENADREAQVKAKAAQEEKALQNEIDRKKAIFWKSQDVAYEQRDAYLEAEERWQVILKYIMKAEAERREADERDLHDPTLSNPADYIDDIIL